MPTSQKVINKVNKELQRFLPTGASKSKKYIDPKVGKKVFVIDSKRYVIDDSYKPKSPRITKRFEEMFSSDHVLSKSPVQSQAFQRNTFSPILAKNKAACPEAKFQLKICSNDNTGFETAFTVSEKDSKNLKNLDKLNGILEACQQANKKDFIVRSKMRMYTQKIKTYVSEVEGALGKTPELILDYGKRLSRESEMRECKERESALKLIYNKVEEAMIKRALSAGDLSEIGDDFIRF